MTDLEKEQLLKEGKLEIYSHAQLRKGRVVTKVISKAIWIRRRLEEWDYVYDEILEDIHRLNAAQEIKDWKD